MTTLLSAIKATTPRIETDAIVLRGKVLLDVATTLSDMSIDDSIVSTQLLSTVLDELNTESSLFSDSLVSYTFSKLIDDPALGWYVPIIYVNTDGMLTYTRTPSDSTNSPMISVPQGRTTSNGSYLFMLDIESISGQVDLLINGIVKESVSFVGKWLVNITIDNHATDIISINFKSVGINESTTISKPILIKTNDVFSYITESLKNNTTTKLEEHVSELNPHAQYLLRSEYTGVLNSLNGIHSTKHAVIQGLKFPRPISFNSLMHTSSGFIDPISGAILSNSTVENIHHVVDGKLAIPNRYAVVPYVNGLSFKYDFGIPRIVSGIVLYLDHIATHSKITQLNVILGDVVIQHDLNPIRTMGSVNTVNIPVADILTTDVIIAITTVEPGIDPEITFGLDINFQQALIKVDPDMTLSIDNTHVQIDQAITIDTSSMVVNRPYTLAYDHTLEQYELLSLPPSLSGLPTSYIHVKDLNVGVLTTIAGDASYLNQYTFLNGVGVVEGTDVHIKYEFNTPKHVHSVALSATRQDFTVEIITSDNASHILRPYVPSVTNTFTILIDIEDVVSVNILYSGIASNAISNISIYVHNALVYDPEQRAWSDNHDRVVLGWLIKYNTGKFKFVSSLVDNKIDHVNNGGDVVNSYVFTDSELSPCFDMRQISIEPIDQPNCQIYKSDYTIATISQSGNTRHIYRISA